MITNRSNVVVIPFVRDSLIIISHIATYKFNLCNKNKNHCVLTIDGYCTCRTSPISCKTDGSLYFCFPLYQGSSKRIFICDYMRIHWLVFKDMGHWHQFTKFFPLNFWQPLFTKLFTAKVFYYMAITKITY